MKLLSVKVKKSVLSVHVFLSIMDLPRISVLLCCSRIWLDNVSKSIIHDEFLSYVVQKQFFIDQYGVRPLRFVVEKLIPVLMFGRYLIFGVLVVQKL